MGIALNPSYVRASSFGWLDIVRLGLVQTAIGGIVVMTTSTLNRIMVVELALPAILPGLLVAFHYFIQVIRPRMGHASDSGAKKTPWIIGGICVLALGGFGAALSTALMASYLMLGILCAAVAFFLIGIGVSISGTSLLALLAKGVNDERRAAAATIVWLMMIFGIALTATLVGGVGFGEWQTVPPEAYMTRAIDSQTLYSWAQNNHWNTNYKTDQPGMATLRYVVRPHEGGYEAAMAARFGHETTRPLLVAAACSRAPGGLLSISTPEVLIETLKVSADGKALIVRLFGVSDHSQSTTLTWHGIKPAAVWLTDLTEQPVSAVSGAILIPAYGVVHLRAHLP